MVFCAGQSRELAKMFWREDEERVEKDLRYDPVRSFHRTAGFLNR